MAWIKNRDEQTLEHKLSADLTKAPETPEPATNGNGSENGHDSNGNGSTDSHSTSGNGVAKVVKATEREVDPRITALKREIHQQVISSMDLSTVGTMGEDQLRREVRREAETLCKSRSDLLSRSERERLINEVLDETFGLGPLEALMRDTSISDILINGPKTVFIERNGRLEETSIAFHDDRHLLQVIQRIVSRTGRRVDETCPMVDARLPDGSRLNAIIPPLAIDGILVSIRRFGARPLMVDDLLSYGSMTREMIDFLSSCIEAKVNVLISGGTGSGKTTLLNAMSQFIPREERVATIEDAAELQMQRAHVVRMETRPANVEGEGQVTTRDLVRNALRMRPDRIIVGECRGAEAFDMLQAMNTGHDGSLTTIHANSTRDGLSRLEMMVGMAGFDLPVWVIRRQIASAIQIVVQVARLTGGCRKVTKISEVTGMEGDTMTMHDIFEFKQTGVDGDRRAMGDFYATGIRPNMLARLEAFGLPMPVEVFERRTL
jgi:pilus assembly protein CpaF